jgi:hypothetical protein
MNQTLQEFLTTHVPRIEIWPFVASLFLAGLLSWLLGVFYVCYGRSLSNRRAMARNFLMIGMTTALIIAVVKSSLALSLGLVGALSIVRFRTAVKEPEELAYLFLTIAVGLGLGAGQWLITPLAFAAILGVLWVRAQRRERGEPGGVFLTVTCPAAGGLGLGEIVELLRPRCSTLRLRRFEASNGSLDALFEVEFEDYGRLEEAARALRQRHESVRVSFLESEGLP